MHPKSERESKLMALHTSAISTGKSESLRQHGDGKVSGKQMQSHRTPLHKSWPDIIRQLRNGGPLGWGFFLSLSLFLLGVSFPTEQSHPINQCQQQGARTESNDRVGSFCPADRNKLLPGRYPSTVARWSRDKEWVARRSSRYLFDLFVARSFRFLSLA